MTGAYEVSMKWMRGYGTRFVWNSVMSTFKAPSNRKDAVRLEMIWAMRRLRLVYVGRSMSKFLGLASEDDFLANPQFNSLCRNKHQLAGKVFQTKTKDSGGKCRTMPRCRTSALRFCTNTYGFAACCRNRTGYSNPSCIMVTSVCSSSECTHRTVL